MKLKKLIVKNYKSLRQLELEDFEDLNVLIGKNDAGKSNILRAMDLLFNSSVDSFRNLKLLEENFYRTVYEGTTSFQFFDPKEPEAEFTAYLDVSKKTAVKLGLHPDDKGDLRIVLSKRIYEKDGKTYLVLDFLRMNKEIIVKTPDEQKRFLQKNGSYSDEPENCIGTSVLEKISNQFIFIPADRNVVRDPAPDSQKLKAENYLEKSLIGLANREDEESKELFQQFLGFIDHISPIIKKIDVEKKDGKVVNIHFMSEFGSEMPLSTIGAGNNELMLLLHELVISGGRILAIEEPEIHLHPEAERKLYKFMEEFAGATQLFLVTHSPVFVRPDNLRGLFRVVKNGETEVHTMNPKRYVDKDRLVQELNAENCEMFFADKVLLVEGISDKIMMEGLIERYCRSLDEIKVVTCYSKDNFEVYVELLKIFKIPYIIMTDLDSLKGRFQIKLIWKALRKKHIKKRPEQIEYLKKKSIHVLSRGALEQSYPKKYRRGVSKPLDALYALYDLTDKDYYSLEMKDLREVVEALEKK